MCGGGYTEPEWVQGGPGSLQRCLREPRACMSLWVCLDPVWAPRGACWWCPAGVLAAHGVPLGVFGGCRAVWGDTAPPQCAPGCEVLVRVWGAVWHCGEGELEGAGSPALCGVQPCWCVGTQSGGGAGQHSMAGAGLGGSVLSSPSLWGEVGLGGPGHAAKRWKGEPGSDSQAVGAPGHIGTRGPVLWGCS